MLMLMPLQEIENLETLSGLEELWLGKNKITVMKVLRVLFGENVAPVHRLLEPRLPP